MVLAFDRRHDTLDYSAERNERGESKEYVLDVAYSAEPAEYCSSPRGIVVLEMLLFG